MKRSPLYAIGAGVLAIVAMLTFTGCGSSTGPLSATSTCADWNNDVNGGDTGDVNSFVTNATGSADPQIISYVTQQCAGNGGLNLAGVMSAASLNASLGN